MRRLEFYVKVPLGVLRTRQYHLEYLATTTGWHFVSLLVCLDNLKGYWRLQKQVKYKPLTKWEYDYGGPVAPTKDK